MILAASLKSASVSAIFTSHDDDACTKIKSARENVFLSIQE